MNRLERALVASILAAGALGSTAAGADVSAAGATGDTASGTDADATASADASTQTRESLVFILSGQSNMVGQGNTADLDETLRTMPSNVLYFLDGERADFAANERFGPEVTFAHELSRALPDTSIVLLKYAVGGTSLLAWAPEWTAESARVTQNEGRGPLYEQLLEMVATVRPRLGQGARMAGVLWMQGERDARFPPAGAAYAANLEMFVRRLREDLGAPELPFLFGQVDPPPDRYPATADVRDAQASAPGRIPASRMVSTAELSKHDDRLHYDTEGQLSLGRRFARAYLEMHVEAQQPPPPHDRATRN